MAGGDGRSPGWSPGRLGNEGPVVVWLFILFYWVAVSLLARGSSESQLPSVLTPSLLLGLTAGVVVEYAPVLLFLLVFVWLYEKRRGQGVRSVSASIGWNGTGVRQSLKWSLVFFVAAIPVGLLVLVAESAVAGSGGEYSHLTSTSPAGLPAWYLPFLVVSLLADVVTEETTVRGYILDRLMPSHPSTLRQSLNATIVASVMMASYHLVPYLYTYGFSPALTVVNLVAAFLYSILVSFAYVRSKVRNVSGPILFHFLLDFVPLLLV